MKKNVSLEKQSKKAQREYYSKRRRTWGTLNPVTRSVPSGKAYNRKKAKQKMRKTSFRSDDGFETGLFPFERVFPSWFSTSFTLIRWCREAHND